MKPKYTLEPWRVDPSDKKWILNKKGIRVALANSEKEAHLIAAAPELFAALERLLKACADSLPSTVEGDEDASFYFAEKVLKKARGAQ